MNTHINMLIRQKCFYDKPLYGCTCAQVCRPNHTVGDARALSLQNIKI